MIKIREVSGYLESLAPLSTQESYDNCGLIIGNPNDEVKGVLVTLDCTEEIIEEAISIGANLIVAHHPIVFKGLKKLTGKDYVERTVLKAIKNDIAIYAIHTNYDNYRFGVNAEIGRRMGLTNIKILDPKANILNKVVCFIPSEHVDTVREAMFDAGAGNIGDYAECGFTTEGNGTYMPIEGADPFEGKIGERSNVSEVRFEVITESYKLGAVLAAMQQAHPYEEVAHEVYTLMNQHSYIGSGMIGEFEESMEEKAFLSLLKDKFNAEGIRYTSLLGKPVRRVAFCGGSGSFLLSKAKRAKADFFVTGDFKYHEFFDAENEIVIADIGHFESEQFTSDRLCDILTKKFPTFAVHLTKVNTNPINYF